MNMRIDDKQYESFLYGKDLKKSPDINTYGITVNDVELYKKYKKKIKDYNEKLNECIEYRGYFIAVPLWLIEYSFGYYYNFRNEGILERVNIEDFSSIIGLVASYFLFLVLTSFLLGYIITSIQAWLLKIIIPKKVVRGIFGFIKECPQKGEKFVAAYNYLQALQDFDKYKVEYQKLYPNIQSVNYNLIEYGQLKIVELIDKLKKYYNQENEKIKRENIRQSQNYWFNLDPYEFENEVALWYERKGYKSEVTKKSGDGGVDIIITKGRKKAYVQCKRYTKSKVDRPTLNQLYGVVCAEGADYGVVVCLLGVTDEAKEFAHKVGIKIVTIGELCPEEDLFHQKNLKSLFDCTVIKVNDYWASVGNIQLQSNIYTNETEMIKKTSKWENAEKYHPIHYCGLVFCSYGTNEDINSFKEWLEKDSNPKPVLYMNTKKYNKPYRRRRKWY